MVEYGYPLGALNFTGDDPVIFPLDCPDLGGFVCSTTVIKAEHWRLGQMKAGDTMQYNRVSLAFALEMRRSLEDFIDEVSKACSSGSFEQIKPLEHKVLPASVETADTGKAIISTIKPSSNQPLVTYRQGADGYLLVEYGEGNIDLNHRCRVTALIKEVREGTGRITFSAGLISTVGCCTSLLIHYDGLKVAQKDLVSYLMDIESRIGDLSKAKVPSRLFKLPITFESKRQTAAIKRYMETQRPYASYLPDNMAFVAENNGLRKEDLEKIFLRSRLLTIAVGFFTALPLCVPVDPRERLNCPKVRCSK